MDQFIRIAWAVVIWGAALGAAGWLLVFWYKRSTDQFLVVRWIVTAIVLCVYVFVALPMVAKGGYVAVAAVFVALLCGIPMVICWAGPICHLVAAPLINIFNPPQEVEPQPLYSMAEARRKRGKYSEAISEVKKQLARFPTDLQGHSMLAEIYAENLNDLPAAYAVLEEYLEQPGRRPKNVTFALNRMADFHLKYERDPDAARVTLQRIVELFPESEYAQMAQQRIAHLADKELLEEKLQPRAYKAPHVEGYLGLHGQLEEFAKPPPEDATVRASKIVEHLQSHPQDYEGREKLAVLYARELNRLDLALDQLAFLLDNENAPMKQVVRWLNLQADILIDVGGDQEAARESLRLIIEKYPKTAAAENAEKRIAFLGKELAKMNQPKTIKLGVYEQNIGLKGEYKRPGKVS